MKQRKRTLKLFCVSLCPGWEDVWEIVKDERQLKVRKRPQGLHLADGYDPVLLRDQIWLVFSTGQFVDKWIESYGL